MDTSVSSSAQDKDSAPETHRFNGSTCPRDSRASTAVYEQSAKDKATLNSDIIAGTNPSAPNITPSVESRDATAVVPVAAARQSPVCDAAACQCSAKAVNVMEVDGKKMSDKASAIGTPEETNMVNTIVPTKEDDGVVAGTSQSPPIVDYMYLGILSSRFFTIQCISNKGKLGEGRFGEVYKCDVSFNDGDKTAAALKIMYKEDLPKDLAYNEAKLMSLCESTNVVSLLTSWELPDAYMLLTELCERGSLRHAIQILDDDDLITRKYMTDVIKGMKWLHERNIAHRDIKMGNILITDCHVAKLGDFGFATKFPYKGAVAWGTLGTKPYMAQEMLTGKHYNPFLGDIYAFGVTFVGAVERRTIRPKHDLGAIVSGYSDVHKKNLFAGLLAARPEERWRITQIESNTWIEAATNVDVSEILAKASVQANGALC